ncbi:MAG: hypothetical protein RIR51_1123 [Bacteroidota bacterium]|jgi:predicted Zn-dependent peptidase
MSNNIKIHTLSNGIRVVHKQVFSTEVSHVGIMLDVGSRDESYENQGTAHFWEHMAFKGTKTRNNLQIINYLEVFGGELNAYTTKEKVCFHASILHNHLEKALKLLTDITFNSTFPQKEIEKEKTVILEEMAMYYDSPEDAIQDDFDEILFPNHSLGMNILGKQDTVNSVSTESLRNFFEENIDTHKIVVSVVGKQSHELIFKMAEKHLSSIPEKKTNRIRTAPIFNKPIEKIVNRHSTQAQVALGRNSFQIDHPDRMPFFMLINLLGGPGMNSILNLAVREKKGLTYQIEASFTSYIDSGFWAIYFGTEKKQVNKALKIIFQEFDKLRNKCLSVNQLTKVKTQLKGQLAMAEESNSNFMLMMAKTLLDKEKIETLKEVFDRIEGVEPSDIQRLANEMLLEDQLSRLIFEPQA